jgi:hypothetical protein
MAPAEEKSPIVSGRYLKYSRFWETAARDRVQSALHGRLDEIRIELDPEDGRLTVLGLGEEGTTAFTRFGIDNLAELVQIYKADPNLLPRRKLPE